MPTRNELGLQVGYPVLFRRWPEILLKKGEVDAFDELGGMFVVPQNEQNKVYIPPWDKRLVPANLRQMKTLVWYHAKPLVAPVVQKLDTVKEEVSEAGEKVIVDFRSLIKQMRDIGRDFFQPVEDISKLRF